MEPTIPSSIWTRWAKRAAVLAAAAAAVQTAIPSIEHALATVSTDDAYVNGHVTFIAARVPGQVTRVLVEDNARVAAGDVLVELDREPYEIQVALKDAAVAKADSALKVAQAQARGIAAQLTSQRYKLQLAQEAVDGQVATLRAKIAALASHRAHAARAEADDGRARRLIASGSITREEVDHRGRTFQAADAQASAALEEVHQIRAALGLAQSGELGRVPADLRLTHASVRQARADLVQTAAQLGITDDVEPAIDAAPAVLDAAAALSVARRELEVAQLNLSWTAVRARTAGVVTRRNVNPGNTIQTGQSLMAVRSLDEIWVDANFKETQLAGLRIGQRVDLHVDMYGSARTFRGRISGFTMGTGSTLALLPAQNATGNFVKVVQRLPVRIDLTEPPPEDAPLFAGLSVEPHVYVKEPPSGPDAGRYLQPRRNAVLAMSTEVRQ